MEINRKDTHYLHKSLCEELAYYIRNILATLFLLLLFDIARVAGMVMKCKFTEDQPTSL